MQKSIFKLSWIFWGIIAVTIVILIFTGFNSSSIAFTVAIIISSSYLMPIISKLKNKELLYRILNNHPDITQNATCDLSDFIDKLSKATDAQSDDRGMFLSYIMNNCTLESLDHCLVYSQKNKLLSNDDHISLMAFREKYFNPALLSGLENWEAFRASSPTDIVMLAEIIENEYFCRNGVTHKEIAKAFVTFLKKKGYDEQTISDKAEEIKLIHKQSPSYKSSQLQQAIKAEISLN